MPTILILEDEPFIALDIETVLEECGQRSFVTLSTGSDALSWLKENSPSAAIVDPRLSDGVCTAVARHLVDSDIPFIVYSGETESVSELEPAFAEGHLLMKPASPEQLVEAVETALYGSDRRRKSGT
ncbi:response regulator [Rhizobium leguminosarum]|uniref:Response regulator with CheY-like receiver, AAA-type ATPase, and DNA-binding domain n=1 Tax=Rhizobium leguminosarum TaxID=384 RepID=A0A2K9Z6K6_RHILE|nr:response regulator [Rhizobium leguminosarum]AUW43869.1 Response regulator with CheY-like receiver, AAA-type ATPase, and DNA-binding domain [Rhizobium leguminosarum]